MSPKTGSDLEEIRALLAEVKALREDVELKGAELTRIMRGRLANVA